MRSNVQRIIQSDDDAQATTRTMAGKPYSILVVDDSPSQRLVLKALLQKYGYTVITASSGKEALSALNTVPCQIIISDWIMPGMSGLELCQNVRSMRHDTRKYFILSSSKSEKLDVAIGLDEGADDFVAKPVDEVELLARVRAGVRKYQLQEELNSRNAELQSAHNQLHDAHNLISRDLEVAARIQTTLVPPAYNQMGDFEVATAYLPCAHLGGDLIGYCCDSQSNVAAYSIDVSGHGIPAALLSTVLSQSLCGVDDNANLAVRSSHDGRTRFLLPHEIAHILNERFQDWGQINQYFTMAYAVIDQSSGQGLLCQAGHPEPAILRANGTVDFIGTGGMPIGMFPFASFETVPFQLEKGDILFLYTDGITEAELPCGKQFGTDGLVTLLKGLKHAGIANFRSAVLKELSLSCRTQQFNDDVSFIAVAR